MSVSTQKGRNHRVAGGELLTFLDVPAGQISPQSVEEKAAEVSLWTSDVPHPNIMLVTTTRENVVDQIVVPMARRILDTVDREKSEETFELNRERNLGLLGGDVVTFCRLEELPLVRSGLATRQCLALAIAMPPTARHSQAMTSILKP